MKTLGLMFDQTDWVKAQEDQDKSIPKISEIIMSSFVTNWSAQKGGLNESDRHIYYKMLDKIQVAVKANATEVVLTDEEFGFLRKCKQEVRLSPGILNRKVEALIDAVDYR